MAALTIYFKCVTQMFDYNKYFLLVPAPGIEPGWP